MGLKEAATARGLFPPLAGRPLDEAPVHGDSLPVLVDLAYVLNRFLRVQPPCAAAERAARMLATFRTWAGTGTVHLLVETNFPTEAAAPKSAEHARRNAAVAQQMKHVNAAEPSALPPEVQGTAGTAVDVIRSLWPARVDVLADMWNGAGSPRIVVTSGTGGEADDARQARAEVVTPSTAVRNAVRGTIVSVLLHDTMAAVIALARATPGFTIEEDGPSDGELKAFGVAHRLRMSTVYVGGDSDVYLGALLRAPDALPTREMYFIDMNDGHVGTGSISAATRRASDPLPIRPLIAGARAAGPLARFMAMVLLACGGDYTYADEETGPFKSPTFLRMAPPRKRRRGESLARADPFESLRLAAAAIEQTGAIGRLFSARGVGNDLLARRVEWAAAYIGGEITAPYPRA